MITIEINTDGAAFGEDSGMSPEKGAQVAKILRALADSYDDGSKPYTGKDVNGNTCVNITYTNYDR